jgi:dynein heavy chain
MNSHDILKHLSVEGSKFLLVDDQFKKISVFYNQTRNVVEITKNKEVVKNLKNCLKNIEIVQKGLSSYLDSKRMNFPRFFSLSDG